MKAMKKLFATACAVTFVLVSCQEESFEGRPDSDNYFASVETFGTDTRTALGEGRSVVWSSEDRIAIFEGSGTGQAYQVMDSYVGKSTGEFAEVEGLVAEGTGADIEGTIAVYPFNEGLSVTSGDDGDYIIEGITFPSEQKYIAGSFSDEAFPMAAVSPDSSKDISFKNIGGILKLSLTGNYSVSKITLTGNSGEPLSGSATVTLGSDGIPSVTMSDDASTSVTLLSDPAVQLDPKTATDFYISIPPTEFEAGFKVTILDGEGKEHGLATHKTNLAERSSILAMPESTPESLDDIELTADTFCSVDFVEGWTETRFGGDGTIVFVKEDEQGRMTHSLMFLPDEENILMPVYIRFDENEIPSYMSFMDTEIYIDGYTDSTVDFTLAVEDAVWSIKDVPCNELMPYSLQTKAWADNNAIRNACAIGELIVGVAGVAGGVVMISASGIGEVMTAGASTPISVAGIALGVMNIKGGCESIAGSLETIFGPAEQEHSTYIKDGLMGIGMEKLSDWIENAPEKDYIKNKLPAHLLKKPADLGKFGTISYWSGFIFSSIDEEWGETYTGPVNLAQVHEDVKVVTGRADNITKDSAELYGYVSPLATAPFGDRILTEIYIVLWKAGDENNKKNHSIFNSDGGTVSFTFINLEPDTEYCYQIIFEDIHNKIYRFGEVNTFKTLSKKPTCQTGEVTNITANSAVICCSYHSIPENAQCQLVLSWADSCKIIDVANQEGTQSISLSELKPFTIYSYYASIDYEGVKTNGDIKEFRTDWLYPTCQTGEVLNITESSAVVECSFQNVESSPFGNMLQCGVIVYCDFDTKFFPVEKLDTNLLITLDGLLAHTQYNYYAVIDNIGSDSVIIDFPIKGNIKQFTTEGNGDNDGRWVDLGLSVLWAAYNVGASSPEEYGGYYAWGETSTKSDYTWENYKHRERDDYDHYHNGDDCWCWDYKFIGNEISGTSYDVAYVQWGGGARMPTLTEVKELVNNCTFTDGSYNGVRGSYVTGPNGNSIFLPFAGYRYDGDLNYEGSAGIFWSGSYSVVYDGLRAYSLCCYEGYGDWHNISRSYGHTVRPVTEK